MGRKKGLFPIGDISKFTGASIKSLRYYERIKILKPAFVDPDSGYRYYSFDQVYDIEMIMLCIELDIPLKDLAKYIDKSRIIDVRTLMAHGKGIARKKLETLQGWLRFIEDVERQIALVEEHQKDRRIYTREIPEKYFQAITMPHGKAFEDNVDILKMFKPVGNDSHEFLEYGLMYERSPEGVRWHAFMELPGHKAEANCKVIPAPASIFASRATRAGLNRLRMFSARS